MVFQGLETDLPGETWATACLDVVCERWWTWYSYGTVFTSREKGVRQNFTKGIRKVKKV